MTTIINTYESRNNTRPDIKLCWLVKVAFSVIPTSHLKAQSFKAFEMLHKEENRIKGWSRQPR